jgi:uncharacterized membrane protein YvlD (DUF360 family)
MDVVGLAAIAGVLPGLELEGWRASVMAIGVIGLLNALVRPVLLRLTLPLTFVTFGLWSLVPSAVSILAAGRVVPGFTVSSWLTALVAPLALAVVNALASQLASRLVTLDDEDALFRHATARLARRRRRGARPVVGGAVATPGLIVLELDGLSRPALDRALARGDMPTLARWLSRGTHRVVSWDCGVPSQTSSSQAGILWGVSDDIPAFRWYEKARRQLVVSSRTDDAALIEGRLGHGTPLLAGGASHCNMFTGGAVRSVLTVSTVRLFGPGLAGRARELYGYFVNPYVFARGVAIGGFEVARELVVAGSLRLLGRPVAAKRGGAFPITRALATVLLRDIVVQLLLEDMDAGLPIAYATFPGYDAVAHCTGVDSPDARRVLRDLDRRVARLVRAAARAERRYDVVVLSDHGQSAGASFRVRHGVALEELIRRAARPHPGAPGAPSEGPLVRVSVGSDEVAGHVNALVEELWPHRAEAGLRLLAERVDADLAASGQASSPPADADIVVCASGNLALVYFPDLPGQASLETVEGRYPALLDTLTRHPGVGFVIARSARGGPTAFGASGAHELTSGRVVGEDPLGPFGPRAVEHLRRLASFPNGGDLIVNSGVDADGSVAPFEEHVGSHGGLGGEQTEAFLLAPAHLLPDTPELVGPASVNALLRRWRDGDGADGVAASVVPRMRSGPGRPPSPSTGDASTPREDQMLDDDAEDDARGGSWLTYAYRFGSATVPHASGTIKAPSFDEAARRLLARRLADRLGPEPAFLRLRAAGEQEVLLQVTRPPDDPAARPALTVVPSDRFRFDRTEDVDARGAP